MSPTRTASASRNRLRAMLQPVKELKQMNVRFEDNMHIGAIVPRKLVEAIDAEAQRELISRSTWVRRLILNAFANKTGE